MAQLKTQITVIALTVLVLIASASAGAFFRRRSSPLSINRPLTGAQVLHLRHGALSPIINPGVVYPGGQRYIISDDFDGIGIRGTLGGSYHPYDQYGSPGYSIKNNNIR